MRYFLILCLILITLVSFHTPPSARAGAITVDGACTLTDAIIAANTDAPSGSCPAGSGADIITLDVDVTITTPYQFFYGLPGIVTDITIQAGAGNTIAGNSVDIQLFHVSGANARLTLIGLTIENSRYLSPIEEIPHHASGGAMEIHISSEVYIINCIFQNNAAIGVTYPDGTATDALGGAIWNNGGYLEIIDSMFLNNMAIGGDAEPFEMGGDAIGGAIAGGTIVVQSSVFDGNLAKSGNGDLLPSSGGGAIVAVDAIIRDSVFTNNTATGKEPSSRITGGAVYIFQTRTVIERSLFSGNSAFQPDSNFGSGGAIFIDTTSQTSTITNSTFNQNVSDVGGAIATDNGLSTNTAVVAFNTFLDNTSVLGADVIALGDPDGVTFTGNIITSIGGNDDCSGMTASNGSDNLNMSGDTSCDVISSGNIIPGTHFSTTLTDEGLDVPEFFPLINVGSNPAIDAVPGCGLTEDQRGLPRDANCDVGSYELQGGGTPTDTPVPPTDTPIPPTDTPTGPIALVASAACVDENLAVTISAGDGPFNITASAGINTPVNGVNIGTTTINGPEKWDNLTVTETSGNGESINLGQFRCRSDERPVPASPAHRAHTTNPFPMFSWTGISNANNYRVFVFDDANPATRTVDIRQNSGGPTSMQLTTPLPNGRLFWRVRGRQNRIWSLWSVRFTLFKDPPPPLIGPTPVPTIDLNTMPTLAPTFPSPPNSR